MALFLCSVGGWENVFPFGQKEFELAFIKGVKLKSLPLRLDSVGEGLSLNKTMFHLKHM